MADSPGRTYRYYTGQPLWEFGFGLSYTTFNISWESNNYVLDSRKPDAKLSFRAKVVNTGDVAGDEVVMAFVQGAPPMIRQLFGFQRVTLNPGQETEVFFSATANTFAHVNQDGDHVLEPGYSDVTISNGLQHITRRIKISGNSMILTKFRRQKKV